MAAVPALQAGSSTPRLERGEEASEDARDSHGSHRRQALHVVWRPGFHRYLTKPFEPDSIVDQILALRDMGAGEASD